MSILKPILIAVLVILAVLIIIKANRFVTSDPVENKEKGNSDEKSTQRATPPPTQTPIEFFLVYIGRRVPVTHYPFTIGSRNDNDLIITDSTVSRQHAELFRRNGQVCIRDLGSLNGMAVNSVPCAEKVVVGGERIQLGTTVLQIERAIEDVSDDTQFIRR